MHITLLLADRCSAANATLAMEVLSAANLFADSPCFEVVLASLDGQAVVTWGGQRLEVDCSVAQVARTDLVLIPGFLFTLKEVLPTFAAYGPWLREQHGRGAVLASMCTAAFLLAETGLLQGLRATTHWAFTEFFRRRYAQVCLDEGQILCEENRLITCGGATAAMDLMLHLIRRFGSAELAYTCGKYLLIDTGRTEQSVYAMWSLPKSHGDSEILRVQHWLEQHFTESLVIDEVARRFGFGVRNFKRRFKDATGHTPIGYLQTLRLERAKQMLESTRMTLDSITYAVGYEDSNSFRRLFQQRVGMLPAAYRKKFLIVQG
ncbi:transcriptional regulator, AraC family [Pseudomonas synxantha BG33R]|jgi:transcriptional regulator GlxA family with amidase domain|uniref:GlxA family transcriptional regulator n=1 Tax=Pseudomonas TaxID=286 RepID=UPI00025FE731|nr:MULTISPECIES: helix-turn-helix domain-containing protein [Pseudomonas]QUW64959.1 helix-turn-helix domain-containing protein [Pseudomonas synxantha]EIK67143.1 transcriptional regulator, AraC family [Pseudomonas synxantha BG33R]MCK3824619.1 helix-turn-helix domain-containing protein [Pseudomonas sp. W2Aug9]MCK3830250.1 helix-turn-helix domain-containing protein [Pseudomonas fluorescens]MCK3843323.1 helix-turn-helix domain-containing protein [Pseudomonas sp. W15Feb34]